jgi:hypothetical protein
VKVYTARNARLLRKMPAQPMSETRTPREAARVEMMSSGRFATRRISAWSQTLSQVRRQKMRAMSV